MKMTTETAKIEGIAMLLETLGYNAAAKDVDASNALRYAQWVLRELKNRATRVDPVTRAKSLDPSWQAVLTRTVESFARMGLA